MNGASRRPRAARLNARSPAIWRESVRSMYPWCAATGDPTSGTWSDLVPHTPYVLTTTAYSGRAVSDEPVQRLLLESMEDPRTTGRPLSDRPRQSQRSLEAYLRAGMRPRWMERLMEIESGMARERRHLATAYAALCEECDGEGLAA